MKELRDQPSILVVDDTRANIGFLLETLTQAGYRVRVAPDGETALEQIQYSPPDLVLLDVMMPGIDGFETCGRIRKIPHLSQLPVIFMTALSDTQDKVRAFAAGADDYVTKPFQSEEVLARVRTHLARRMLEGKLEQANRELESRVAARTAELTAALSEVERLKSRLQQENRYLKEEIAEAVNLGGIIGSSPALRAALHQVAVVAPTDTTVLIWLCLWGLYALFMTSGAGLTNQNRAVGTYSLSWKNNMAQTAPCLHRRSKARPRRSVA